MNNDICKISKIFLILLTLHQVVSAQPGSNELLQADMRNSLESGWLEKKVFASKPLDYCEELTSWSVGGEATMSLDNTRKKQGGASIRFVTSVVSSDSSAPYPTSFITKEISNGDWEDYNRISAWIYAERENSEFAYLSLDLRNSGKEKVPNRFRKKGRNFFKVETNRWNRVVWEIPALPRDMVSSLAIVYTINGKTFSGTGDSLRIYVDQIELQQVTADYEEGWQVAPGKIAFSHTGYSTGGNKTAVANHLDAEEFSIIDASTGGIAYKGIIENTPTRFGEFQLMDFSDLRIEGEYLIEADTIKTRPFTISNDVWSGTIWKNLNFWRSERCGEEVPGIHDNCHRDVYAFSGNKKIVINGGWHDAGDLTQMIYNTGDAVYIMLSLAQKVRSRDPDLYNALVSEAKWGLAWMLKTRFGKGYRHYFGGISKWTDGIIGTGDDIYFEAENLPYENFLSAMTISKAALFFTGIDDALARQCRIAAIEDWVYAVEGITSLNVELCGNATISSVNLFKLTGDSIYLQKAVEWADILINSQQQSYPEWDIPLVGFFYKDTTKEQVLRYNPIGMDQAPILALASLCELLPEHPKWMDWYSSIVLYAEYVKKSAELSNPFRMIPHSIYHLNEIHKPSIYGFQQSTLAKYEKYEEKEPQYKEQVMSGLSLGEGHYLRTFPVWYTHRGSAGMQLSQAKGLAVASHLRNDPAGIDLAESQAHWIVGRNPFSQSTMYGEGYDFAPFYFVSSGPITGALACGIQTGGNNDIPNWPASNCYNYKEIWTHTTNRWLWLMEEVNGASRVSFLPKRAGQSVEITDIDTGNKLSIETDEQEKPGLELPAGTYRFISDGLSREHTLLPGMDYQVDLKNEVDFSVITEISENDECKILVTAAGRGKAKFELRGFNISVDKPVQMIQLGGETPAKVSWEVHLDSKVKPWVAVIIANDDLSTKKEVYWIGASTIKHE